MKIKILLIPQNNFVIEMKKLLEFHKFFNFSYKILLYIIAAKNKKSKKAINFYLAK